MAKKKRQNLMEREKNKKGDGTITRTQLLSCYVSSLIIVVLCVWEGLKPETRENGDPTMYFILAALGVVYSVIITKRNNDAKKKAQGGNRLK
jgi:hypothetical protein